MFFRNGKTVTRFGKGEDNGFEPMRWNCCHKVHEKASLAKSNSGDGVLWEVINGLMQRPDWEKSIAIPVGIIPAGTAHNTHDLTAYFREWECRFCFAWCLQGSNYCILVHHQRFHNTIRSLED
jgi:hypothetical protein